MDEEIKKLDRYLDLARLSEESFQARRSYEWKINFGLWSGIALFTWFMISNDVKISGDLIAAILSAYVIVLIIFFLNQLLLHRANKQDKLWKHFFIKLAEGIKEADERAKTVSDTEDTDQAVRPPRKMPKCGQIANGWLWNQTATTALLLVLSLILIIGVQSTNNIAQNDRISGENLRLIIEKLPAAPQRSNP